MSDGVDFLRMRDAVRTSGVEWQRHALERMVERSIRRADVLEVVRSGEPIEIYPADRPFPSALFLGWIGTRPLHVVAAFDPERIACSSSPPTNPISSISSRAFG